MDQKGIIEKMQLTFDEYDQIIEKFEEMSAPTYWPTVKHIDLMEKNPNKWILFACYLTVKGTEPRNNEERYSKKNLLNFIQRHLDLVDASDEVYNKPAYA